MRYSVRFSSHFVAVQENLLTGTCQRLRDKKAPQQSIPNYSFPLPLPTSSTSTWRAVPTVGTPARTPVRTVPVLRTPVCQSASLSLPSPRSSGTMPERLLVQSPTHHQFVTGSYQM